MIYFDQKATETIQNIDVVSVGSVEIQIEI